MKVALVDRIMEISHERAHAKEFAQLRMLAERHRIMEVNIQCVAYVAVHEDQWVDLNKESHQARAALKALWRREALCTPAAEAHR
jgi:hypothetical protein